MTDKILDRIEKGIRAASAHDPNALARPVAILWPDEHEQWAAIVPQLSTRLRILTLGAYDGQGTGPGYWLRCAVAGTLDNGDSEGIPIVYLPGITRERLRAVEECPSDVRPIAELQYRSQWFSHPNGRDWTVRGFLSNGDRGVGLSVADDAATHNALVAALPKLVDLPVARLTSRHVDAAFLNELVSPDPIRSILDWLDDPKGHKERTSSPAWSAFVQQCKTEYGFDPETEGELVAARKLGEASGSWEHVWKRYREAPGEYPSVPERLRRAKPEDLLSGLSGRWPQDNQDHERSLRDALIGLAGQTAQEARAELQALESTHQQRRGWVWADLGQAPLAFALEQLAALADRTVAALRGDTVDALAKSYSETGWRADDSALRALAAVDVGPDREAVAQAVLAVYRPWVDASAKAFQAAVGPLANAGTYQPGAEAATSSGTVTVFVDGLRLDLANRLAERLTGANFSSLLDTTLAALPTVTQTAKPVLTPVPSGALGPGQDLHAARVSSGARADIQVLRSLMQERGLEVLTTTQTGDPSGSAWTETGEIDHRGHDLGARLVDYLDEEIERIAHRIRELLDAGWNEVVVVTDHGWQLIPGGLSKVELPVAAADTKKGRCARLKDGAQVSVPTVPWHWDPDVRIALAPGVTCFEAGKEYEHGGVSLQECVVPRITVTRGTAKRATGGPEITKVKWLHLLCRIEVAGLPPGTTVDIRGLPADVSTSIAETAKETSGTGRISLMVPDEDLEGERAHIVVLAPDGEILAQKEVTIGVNR